MKRVLIVEETKSNYFLRKLLRYYINIVGKYAKKTAYDCGKKGDKILQT